MNHGKAGQFSNVKDPDDVVRCKTVGYKSLQTGSVQHGSPRRIRSNGGSGEPNQTIWVINKDPFMGKAYIPLPPPFSSGLWRFDQPRMESMGLQWVVKTISTTIQRTGTEQYS
uniref:Uncharacterized protein n=1 Tax=Nelumbo nucifera TaxID=4432 RepID=A0A822YY65_NELNU|nr:TPA_asm: hypothetical protein HUJ06_004838 [Nelumbo nucifera]